METIILYRGKDGWWQSQSNDPERMNLFGTSVLPTAMRNCVSASVVLADVRALNPQATVELAY